MHLVLFALFRVNHFSWLNYKSLGFTFQVCSATTFLVGLCTFTRRNFTFQHCQRYLSFTTKMAAVADKENVPKEPVSVHI